MLDLFFFFNSAHKNKNVLNAPSLSLRTMCSLGTFRVPTKQEVCCQETDASQLSEHDLRTLRTQDTFMYHSIPAVHKATLTLQEANIAKTALTQGNCAVTRKSRISTECCMELLMEDFFDDEEFDANFKVLEKIVLEICSSQSSRRHSSN